MKKSELIALAQKKGVAIGFNLSSSMWVADIDCPQEYQIKCEKKISKLIKFLADNNIKIKN
jgi:hypothetical protein